MQVNGKWYKYIVWKGKAELIECKNHFFSWSGKMPCTGLYKCSCGYVKENAAESDPKKFIDK